MPPVLENRSLANQNVLVAGGTGFVGQVLARKLEERGAFVTVLSRRHPREICTRRTIVVDDWHPQALGRALSPHRYDAVFNLAVYGVAPAARDIGQMMRINVDVASALVCAAKACGARMYVHVGSCSEYDASSATSAIAEEHLLQARGLYGASKAAGTLVACATAAAEELAFVAARLFHVYGSGESDHRLMPTLARRLSAGERVPLSPGTQVRDFLHVDDAADGLLSLACAGMANGGQHIVNLGSGVATSVRDFALAVSAATRTSPSLLGFGDIQFRPDDVMHLVADTRRLRGLTDWRPKRDVTTGIVQALQGLKA